MQNFYDENKDIYSDYLSQLDIFLPENSYSIYLRGSANKSKSHSSLKPWDVDFVLFSCSEISAEKVDAIKLYTVEFNDRITSRGYPHIDIRFQKNKIDDVSSRYICYLLKTDGYIIKGPLQETINNAEMPSATELYQLYNQTLALVIRKYHHLPLANKTNHDYENRLKNLIKSIARCGCILLLAKRKFLTRDVNSGLDALYEHCTDDVFLRLKLPLSDVDYSKFIARALDKMSYGRRE